MQNKNVVPAGFTLLELLVVVLIAGILASIALPQYQKAVDKADATEAIVQGRALIDAQQRHFTLNGSWSNDLEVLDIEVPGKLEWECSNSTNYCYTKRDQLRSGAWFTIAEYHAKQYSLFCVADENKPRAIRLCSSLGTYSHTNAANHWKAYTVFAADFR